MIASGGAVELVHWPIEAPKLDRLRADGRPRLLLIGPTAPPPAPVDALEDWVREPAPALDVAARVAVLEHRWSGSAAPRPTIDDHGVLTRRGESTPLGPTAAPLAAALIRQFDALVTREDLVAAGWPAGLKNRNSFDVALRRLRRQLAPLGLDVVTIRSRGYRLSETCQNSGTT